MVFPILIGIVCFAGGLLNGATGFGSLLVMVPMLLMVCDMQTAIPLGVTCCVLLQFLGALAFRRGINKRALARLLLGSLPGIWLGVSLLGHARELYMKTTLGVLFFAYALWCLTHKPTSPQKEPRSFWAYFAGFCSGAFGGAFGINGPPVVIYTTRTGWPPDAMRGTLNALLTIEFLLVMAVHFIQGLLVAKVWKMALFCMPLCLLGNRIGIRIARRLRPEQYMRLVLVMILAMGFSLCVPALRLLIEVF
ncbi:MAG: sulfite exporter TauE/SafE family protein [Desulfovibrio sp.]|jgi:uncharacterized membrane protein YfcA|nr:sulfite exporter TauE/SafE family protein [Desulfovibrio sp.]